MPVPGDRVSGSSLVYTIDEKGEINDLIRENADTVDLTDDNFSQIRGDMKSFMDSYDDTQFGDVYEFQSNMESMVMELVNQSMLDSLAEAEMIPCFPGFMPVETESLNFTRTAMKM